MSTMSSGGLLKDTTSNSEFVRLKESREDLLSSQNHDVYSLNRVDSEVFELRSMDRKARNEAINISLEDTILLDIEDSPWRQIYDILAPSAAISHRDRVVIPTCELLNIERHIIVSGDPSEAMLSFIAPLRSRILAGSFQTIVFLHPTQPSSNFINVIAHFTDIYFIQVLLFFLFFPHLLLIITYGNRVRFSTSTICIEPESKKPPSLLL